MGKLAKERPRFPGRKRGLKSSVGEDVDAGPDHDGDQADGNEDLVDGKLNDLPHGSLVSLAFLALGQVDLTAGGSVRLLGDNLPKAHGEELVFTAFHVAFLS